METLTRTIYGSALQTALLTGLPYTPAANSTLNERFNVRKTDVIPQGQYPKLQYLTLGIGGTKLIAGENGQPKTERIQHQATDASCYKPYPFVLRATNNDLSITERQRYALRVQQTHNGNQYWAYYLRRIDISDAQVLLEKRTIEDGVIISTPFTPTNDNLVPQEPNVSNTGSNIVTNEYATVSTRLNIPFTEADCAELLNVASIMFNDQSYAIISEIGFCSGLDKNVSLGDGSTFTEAIGVQILSFVNTLHAIEYTQGGINGEYDVGANEPLYATTPSP